MRFAYKFNETGSGNTSEFPLGAAMNVLESLDPGQSVTITRLPDKHYVPVKLVTKGGGLSVKTYTYAHTAPLGAGVLVQVPSQRWQHGEPAFGVVQAAGVDPASATESIVRVVS